MLPVMIALLLDLIFKDPPNRFHPTAWMGSLIYRLWQNKAPRSPIAALLKGMGISLFVSLLFGSAAYGLTLLIDRFIPWHILRQIVYGGLLYFTFSLARLFEIARMIQRLLQKGDLRTAREQVAWHLVSRDTNELSGSELSEAVLESLAENLTDSLISPLIYFLLFGLPGAVIFRVFNTCDAILGYRDPKRERLGKFPARVDDLLGLIPARITGIGIALVSLISKGSVKSLSTMLRDHRKTASPNAGWTMAAAAGAVDRRLEKPGVYSLNGTAAKMDPDALGYGIVLCRRTSVVLCALLVGIAGVVYGL